MLKNSRNPSNVMDYIGNLGDGMDEHHYEDYNMTNSHDHESNYLSPSENISNSESGINNYVSHAKSKCPYIGKKNWTCSSTVKDGLHSKALIRPKNKVKRLKNRKSRGNDVNNRHNRLNQPDTNILKTRLKLGPEGLMTINKSKFKKKNKVRTSFTTSMLNGISQVNTDINNSYYGSSDVPNDLSSLHKTINNGIDNKRSEVESPYAQYLELKPSVKFKCSRCGINDFSSMALLQEHLINCDGHASVSGILNSFPERSTAVSSMSRNLKIKRQVLFCSSCSTYYQHYKMFIHMRETHNLQICLFCTITFSKSNQLWNHLITTHNRTSRTFATATQVRDEFKGFYVTCCDCNSMFSEKDKFDEHKCELYENLPKRESYCSSCKPSNYELSSNMMNGVDTTSMPGNNNELTSGILEKNDSDSFMNPTDDSLKMMSSLDVSEREKHVVEESKMVTSYIESMSDEIAVRENMSKEFAEESSDFSKIDHISGYISQNVESDETAEPMANEITKNEDDGREPKIVDTHNEKATIYPTVGDTEPKSNKDFQSSSHRGNVSQKTEDKETNWLDSGGEIATADMLPHNNEIQQIESVKPPQPLTMALMLDEAVASLSIQTIIKECIRTTCSTCPYCYHATVISVNCSQLASHLRSEHRFMPTKNEDSAEKVVEKLDEAINDFKTVYMNDSSTTSSVEFDGTFSCLQCAFSTAIFKDLCHHKRKQHHKIMFLCVMCKCNFASYSHLLCHFCPGVYSAEVKHTFIYRCCFCSLDKITSEFRLVVHLRKKHQACDICLTRHRNQSELYSHMIKMHKMNHQCYKCNLAYRSRDGINEHLFWKHGTESSWCKRCLQKKWPHAYHFCIPASTYVCEECNRIFTKAVALTVHRRIHNGDFPSACIDCDQRFICKKLLSLHRQVVHGVKPELRETDVEKNVFNAEAVEKSNCPGNKDDRKRGRKKRKKKVKTDIEKPLLDELPPLNLSSESDEDFEDEDGVKLLPHSLPSVSPVIESQIDSVLENSVKKMEVFEDKAAEDVRKTPESVTPVTDEPSTTAVDSPEVAIACDPIPSEELFPEMTLNERIKNCLVVEHSYCLPDSIFRSESVDASQSANEHSFEGVDQKLSSSKSGLKTRDKSNCKSITPHKRKRAKRDSSTSDSSSNSDSSSSSCGSNCSCNQKSISNCSSSSSESECFTTPDKKKNTKTSVDESKIDSTITNDEDDSQREDSSLNAHESDLDTDILTSGEDFYDEYPTLVSRVEAEPELPTLPTPSIHITSRRRSRDRKGRKRRRAPKITINLASHVNRNDFSISLKRVDQKTYPYDNLSYKRFVPKGRHHNVRSDLEGSLIPNITSSHNLSFNSSGKSSGTLSGDSEGRRSKRERTKNRFYGYSSSDEASDNDSMKAIMKKRHHVNRSSKTKLPFVGIRAKKSLIMSPKSLARTTQPLLVARGITRPSLPTHLYRMPNYIMQQQQQQQQLQCYSKTVASINSSDNSDSDNLVINEPSLNERKVNNQQNCRLPIPATYNYHPRPMGPGQQLSGSSPVPGKSDVKLYCHCRCPYDEVSEMIGCDGENCKIEWFHFECVGIMVPPKGQWYCRECRNSREGLSNLL